MEEEKNLLEQVDADSYDAADRPFDFVGTDSQTVLICESDPAKREKIANAFKGTDFQTTEAGSARDALKNMRFHIYNVVILNENFDTTTPDQNDVLMYLENLAMATRRQIFIALVSDRFRTMDNMAAFNSSVNLVINTKNIDDIVTIVERGMADNDAFYHVFRETLKKMGRA